MVMAMLVHGVLATLPEDQAINWISHVPTSILAKERPLKGAAMASFCDSNENFV